MKPRPVAYLVRQDGLREFSEVAYTKKEAAQLAADCLWWGTKVTVCPLYAGKEIKWISKRQAKRRAGRAK